MEEYVSFHKVITQLQYFQEQNERLNSFGYGNLVDFGKNVSGTTVVYPFMFVIPQSVQYDENTTTYQVSILFADRLNETLDNEVDAISDMSLTARLFLSEIKRGYLGDYFDIILPQQGQPFMERFNDNVAGVALDANIVVYEDVNACPQYPTPTPSNTPNLTPTITPTNTPTISLTPSITPTNTVTPSITPSIGATSTPTVTPTNTPTPSSTPTIFTPQTLNALWWIDFTDASTLTTAGGVITTATDKISNVIFTASTSSGGGPLYYPTGYLGVSGMVQTNATQLQNAGGDYGSVSDYTWFGRLFDDVTSQRGGKIIAGAASPGFGPNPAMILMSDFNYYPPPGPIWTFLNRLIALNENIQVADWTDVAMRSFYSGSTLTLEVWENGSIIGSDTITSFNPITADPIFSLMYDGGIDYNTEQFFFDRKLTDSEMAQMFNYLNLKY